MYHGHYENFFFLALKPLTTVDSHTVPSSSFTRSNNESRHANGHGAVETMTRQIGISTMNGNDGSLTNGTQQTIIVKDPKVTPSLELIGAVTRAKDGS